MGLREKNRAQVIDVKIKALRAEINQLADRKKLLEAAPEPTPEQDE